MHVDVGTDVDEACFVDVEEGASILEADWSVLKSRSQEEGLGVVPLSVR